MHLDGRQNFSQQCCFLSSLYSITRLDLGRDWRIVIGHTSTCSFAVVAMTQDGAFVNACHGHLHLLAVASGSLRDLLRRCFRHDQLLWTVLAKEETIESLSSSSDRVLMDRGARGPTRHWLRIVRLNQEGCALSTTSTRTSI